MSKIRKSVQKNQAQKRDRQYKERLRLLSRFGVYSPSDKKLTKHRKRIINEKWRQFGHDISGDNLILIEYPKWVSKQSRDKIKSNARSLQMTVTPKGIVYHKEGQRRGKIRYDRANDEFVIELSGRRKFGTLRGKKITTHVPLASADQIAAEKDRLRKMADQITVKRKKNEYLIFRVSENGVDGLSHNSFGDIESLLNNLDQYQKQPAHRLQFYRHISIDKITLLDHNRELDDKLEKRAARKRARRRKTNATGRSV